jgi:enoyl-CoA hydratase
MVSTLFTLREEQDVQILQLQSADGTNRLARSCVLVLINAVQELAVVGRPLVIAGNDNSFSVGADLAEIAKLDGPTAFEFSKMGQALMLAIEQFPAPVFAAISGYCMGGGLDLALACHKRMAAPNVLFGHRGAALGLITGWGGTQRLPRLVGKARALQMFLTAEKMGAREALRSSLIDAIADEPVADAIKWIRKVRNLQLQVAEATMIRTSRDPFAPVRSAGIP